MEDDNEQRQKNYKPYKELSLEILAALPDDELEHVVLDYIFGKFTEAHNAEMRLEIILRMSLGFQMIWFTRNLLVSVLHGGFNEFFYNESNQVTHLTLQSLKMIDATECADLLEQAIELHREEMRNPVMQALYSEQTLHGYSESGRISSLLGLDHAFLKFGFRLREFVVRYIRANPHLFIGS